MGLIVDSSAAIIAERRRFIPTDFVEDLWLQLGNQEIALSAVGLTELLHGVYRATAEHRLRRRSFIDGLLAELPVYSYTAQTAELAGRIDAEQRMSGIAIPFADLLIGATALSLGYSVLTNNLRHFNLIPGLNVISY